MAHLRRSRSAADALGRRRSLSAPATAGSLVRILTERLGNDLQHLWTDDDTVEFQIDGSRNVDVLTVLRDDPARVALVLVGIAFLLALVALPVVLLRG